MRVLRALGVFVVWLALGTQAHARQNGPADVPGVAPAGDAAAGKLHYTFGNTSCTNCHGVEGQGAFGPPLAGGKLTFERFRTYVRNPAGRMPAYPASELTDQEIADMVAYFATIPGGAKPLPWRFELPPGAPRGQQLAIAVIGCAQCHGPTFVTPRHGAAEVNGDWEWFKRMVYDHTTAQWEQWKQMDPSITPTTPLPAGPPGRNRVRMGNYSRARLPEPVLREMWDWAMDLGALVPLAGRITPGTRGPKGVVYMVQIVNAGVKGKGLDAEDVTIDIRNGAATVATWRVPRLASGERQEFTVTVAAPATLKGTIRWAKPAVRSDAEVEF